MVAAAGGSLSGRTGNTGPRPGGAPAKGLEAAQRAGSSGTTVTTARPELPAASGGRIWESNCSAVTGRTFPFGTDGVELDAESRKKLDEVIDRRISMSSEVQSEAIRRRIDNMQAIERGNWPEFEDPDRHEERRLDGKVMDSEMAGDMSFVFRWGNSCGMPFDAKEFFERHPQYDYLEGYLKDRPTQP